MDGEGNLVANARAGDAEAWAALYRAHAGRLVVWLRHLCPDDSTLGAEDLAADAWVTAAEKVGSFDGNDDDFVGWLFGIARNHARNAGRLVARRATYASDRIEVGSSHPGSDTLVISDDWVRWALTLLKDRERDVVVCTEVVGLDTASTAQALGISQVAVRVARHRGLSRLRQLALD